MDGSILIQRAWQKMLSGRRLDVIDPSPLDIEIGDIAHGLAFQARWNGQTKGDFVFSVANHSILVWNIFSIENPKIEKKWQLVSLLHDAPEYVIGDLISPVKKEVGSSYINLEKKLLFIILILLLLLFDIMTARSKKILKIFVNILKLWSYL